MKEISVDHIYKKNTIGELWTSERPPPKKSRTERPQDSPKRIWNGLIRVNSCEAAYNKKKKKKKKKKIICNMSYIVVLKTLF